MGKYLLGVLLSLLYLAVPLHAQQGYEVQRGDSLQVEVLEDPDLNRTTLVLPDGSINFPLAGTVQAAGRTVGEIQSSLADQLAPNFAAQPNVFVSIAQLAVPELEQPQAEPTIDAFIMGQVQAPGKKEITPGTTLLQFLAQAGGLTEFAARQRIELRRADAETGEVHVYRFSYDGTGPGPRIRGSTVLAPGDVVVVPQRGLFE